MLAAPGDPQRWPSRLGHLEVEAAAQEADDLALERDALAGEEAPHQIDRLSDADRRPYRRVAGQRLEVAAGTHHHAQTAARRLPECGGDLGGERRVPGVRVGHGDPQPDPLRGSGGKGQPHPRVARPLLVRMTESVEAKELAQLHEPRIPLGRLFTEGGNRKSHRSCITRSR